METLPSTNNRGSSQPAAAKLARQASRVGWSRGAVVVGEALAEIDAEHAEEYRAAALQYAVRLRALDETVRTKIAAIPEERRVLITSHDAFRYFGRAYGLEVRGLQGISTASSAGVKDVEQMVDLIVSRRIKAVFVESSVSPKAIEAVREGVQARGHDVKIGGELFRDAMGDHAPVDTYVGKIEHNVKTLVDALK